MGCYLTDEEKNTICPENERAELSTKERWYKQRKYCLRTCNKGTELELLKKIYWELRKQKEVK